MTNDDLVIQIREKISIILEKIDTGRTPGELLDLSRVLENMVAALVRIEGEY